MHNELTIQVHVHVSSIFLLFCAFVLCIDGTLTQRDFNDWERLAYHLKAEMILFLIIWSMVSSSEFLGLFDVNVCDWIFLIFLKLIFNQLDRSIWIKTKNAFILIFEWMTTTSTILALIWDIPRIHRLRCNRVRSSFWYITDVNENWKLKKNDGCFRWFQISAVITVCKLSWKLKCGYLDI